MSIFSSLFDRSRDYEDEDVEESVFDMPELHAGMTLEVETAEGEQLFSARVAEAEGTVLTLERLPGALSFRIQDLGTSLTLHGLDNDMNPFYLKGDVQESTRLVCKLKNLKVKPISEHRANFRLRVDAPATMFYPKDRGYDHPEECTLVDISTGGACIESEYLHAEDEVLRLKVKLADYAPMEFLGEVIRVLEIRPGKFRYGFLFAQLNQNELTDLTRTLYNLQTGNRATRVRSEGGHW